MQSAKVSWVRQSRKDSTYTGTKLFHLIKCNPKDDGLAIESGIHIRVDKVFFYYLPFVLVEKFEIFILGKFDIIKEGNIVIHQKR